MTETSKNKWIAVVVALVVAAFFFGGTMYILFSQKVDSELLQQNGPENGDTLDIDDISAEGTISGGQQVSGANNAASALTAFQLSNNKNSNMNTQTTASGLVIENDTPGTGDTAVAGKTVSVHYVGTLQDGTKFDSSVDRGQPIQFILGVGQVIKGWDEGIAGMKVGGKRRLVIPPALGYGDQGAGGVIPPNATLVFDVELVEVGK